MVPAFALLIFGCFHSRAPLRIAVHPWIGYQTLILAQDESLIDSSDIHLIRSSSLSESSELLRAGKVDGAALTLDEVLALASQGVDLSVVLIFDASAGADLVVAKPEISSCADLRGRTIGMEDNILSRLLLDQVLKKGNLTRRDVNLKYDIVQNHPAFFRRDRLDALITYVPQPKAFMDSLNILFSSEEIPWTIIDVLAIRSDRLSKYRSQIRTIVRAHFRMVYNLRTGNPDTIYRLAPLIGLEPADTRLILSKLVFPDESQSNYLFGPGSSTLRQSTLTIADLLRKDDIQIDTGTTANLFVKDFIPNNK